MRDDSLALGPLKGTPAHALPSRSVQVFTSARLLPIVDAGACKPSVSGGDVEQASSS